MKKHIIIAAAFAACSAFAQDAPPAPEGPPSDAPGMHNPHHRGDGPRRQGPRPERRGQQMNPGIMIIGEELVMAKYDTDKDGKLNDEEMTVLLADVKKDQEAKKAAILKKFDKDGDGKLSAEERKAMHEEWLKDHPEAAKRMEEMKAKREAREAEMLKKFDKDGDGKLNDEEKKARREEWLKDHPEAARRMERGGDRGPRGPRADGPDGGPRGPMADGPRPPRGPEGRRGGEGRRGEGPRGPRPSGPGPQLDPNRAPIMAAGWMLIEEKYDADKDGKLNEAETAQMKADADKALSARREARKAARKAAREERDLPPPQLLKKLRPIRTAATNNPE